MKKKNGFTLVELLSAIVILGLIASITVYLVVRSINKVKENAKLITYNNIKDISKIYTDEVAGYWNIKDSYEYSCISLGNMIEVGYFDEKVINDNDELSKDTMVKVIRNKESKVIKETSFSFEDSILSDVDCNYQSSVFISTSPSDLSEKVTEVNAKILYNTLGSDYYRYFYISGFSENTVTTNDIVYACDSIGSCSNNTVNNLESGHWYLANSEVVRLSVKSNGVVSAFINYSGANVAEATKNIDAIFDSNPPVISLSIYKIGSYEGNTPKSKGEFITNTSSNYVVNEWKNYGYWFDISTDKNAVIKWTYNSEGSVNGDTPSNSGANCNNACSKTLSGNGNRKAIIEAIDEAGNSSKIEVNIYIDRTVPSCTLNVNTSTITAISSDNMSQIMYNGWNSSYSGDSSTSRNIGIGTHTYYVKDTAGNINSCSLEVTDITKKCTQGYSIEGNSCVKRINAYSIYKADGWCRCEGNNDTDIDDVGCYMRDPSIKSSVACSSCRNGYYLKENHCSAKFSYYWCSDTDASKEDGQCVYRLGISYECASGYTNLNNSYCYKN